ncbi:choice-of-anchor A family protein [Allorhodopirellula heiligendammensis]|uniref:Uncharacterized protein n=1 Tax=Allorhodopirellula heiligendammensis TaxID=2714739 RepID=A0A5C6BUU1_9BACT|nr:choice-of-anchor A family protein [Allorhodopirellula heiligendammensis]TWU15818.1 hypothetical protein Poly21_30200 [Allorhodopirellula heiligendammensis]
MVKHVHLIVLAAGLALSANSLHAAIINEFTMISLGDYNSGGTEVEGSAFVGGDTVGQVIVGTNSPFIQAGDTSLAVVGNIGNGATDNSSGNFVFNDTTTVNGAINNGPGGSTLTNANLEDVRTSAANELLSTSSYLAGLTANSTASFTAGPPGPVIFDVFAISANPNGVAVFNIPAGARIDQIQSIQFNNAAAASAIVINVSDEIVNFTANVVGSELNDEAFKAKTIWNYHQATSVRLGTSVPGATLAPLAAITIAASTEGAVFGATVTQSGGEIHGPNFAPNISPTAVPEPSSTLLLGLAIIGACGVSYRRRRSS